MPITRQALEERLRFSGEKKPTMKRRSDTHDYHERRFYMITLAVEGRHPVLGDLQMNGSGDSEMEASIMLSSLGKAVEQAWLNISAYYPAVSMVQHVVMPDHLHGIIYVSGHIDFHPGQAIKGFKLACNRELRRLLEEARQEAASDAAMVSPQTRKGDEESEEQKGKDSFTQQLLSYAAIKSQPLGRETLWEPGYNDKILFNYSTLDKWKAYISDNPLRLAVRRMHPDLFRVRFNQQVAGRSYAAIGNRFLLHRPERLQVQLSRKLTEEEIEERVRHFMTKARGGAVLVSPAISPAEQRVMRAALDASLPLIFLTPWGFNSFSKPGHRYYDACAEGRFLILAPWEHHNERINLTRQMCLALNSMTEEICRS